MNGLPGRFPVAESGACGMHTAGDGAGHDGGGSRTELDEVDTGGRYPGAAGGEGKDEIAVERRMRRPEGTG